MRANQDVPLSERLRPQSIGDILGQEQLLSQGAALRNQLEIGVCPSLILWGPPGCGKTTLAQAIKSQVNKRYQAISAVSSGVKDVKAVIQAADKYKVLDGEATLLFIDEIHRFNKSQQDALLQAVEQGIITLIGATTENPSFEVNNALLSRCQLLLLSPLGLDNLKTLARKALHHDAGMKMPHVSFHADALEQVCQQAQGDARYLLNQIEWVIHSLKIPPHVEFLITLQDLDKIALKKPLRYDKKGEDHYNLISVFHKSIRGSDVQATLYWLHRMLQAGEEPHYLLRRMTRIANEDIGLADPQAILQANAAREVFDFLGIPEGLLALDQLAIYLATAPKSNKVETAYFTAENLVRKHGNLPVPRAFRNAVNKTGTQLGYGKGYQYDHHSPEIYSGQEHLPEGLEGSVIYEPGNFGFEKEIAKRLDWWEMLKLNKQKKS